jgi:rfaE bifunctional protein kinase chain/domain
LIDVREHLAGKCVLIVGDVMLDEYIWGYVTRISPEAPVPIVRVSHRTYRPGGAANVAANVAALAGVPLLCGVVGNDTFSSLLPGALDSVKAQVGDGLLCSPERATTVKTRVVGQNQQMLRYDVETDAPLSPQLEGEILAWCENKMPRADACVLSDYAKGVVSRDVAQGVIALARRRHLPIVVDPKGRDYGKYRGATIITPNLHEALAAVGHTTPAAIDLSSIADQLRAAASGTDILITQGADGMTLFQIDRSPLHIPAKARRIYDVSGAGDTVTAVLALGLAAGVEIEQASRLANLAAGIVVSKFGTATVSLNELTEEGSF